MKVFSSSASESSSRDVLRESLVLALAESIKLTGNMIETREILVMVLGEENELVDILMKGGDDNGPLLLFAHANALQRADQVANKEDFGRTHDSYHSDSTYACDSSLCDDHSTDCESVTDRASCASLESVDAHKGRRRKKRSKSGFLIRVLGFETTRPGEAFGSEASVVSEINSKRQQHRNSSHRSHHTKSSHQEPVPMKLSLFSMIRFYLCAPKKQKPKQGKSILKKSHNRSSETSKQTVPYSSSLHSCLIKQKPLQCSKKSVRFDCCVWIDEYGYLDQTSEIPSGEEESKSDLTLI